MPYPAVLDEFVDTLNWLRITHEERSMLEEIMHLEMPANAMPNSLSLSEQHSNTLQSNSVDATHRRRGDISKRRRQTDHASIAGIQAHTGPGRLPVKARRRNLASKQARVDANDSRLGIASTNTPVGDSHLAFMVPWQSADLPLWTSGESSETSAGGRARESTIQSSSSSAMDHPTPSENATEEEEEESHDYIKIPWSDDTME